MEKIVDQGQKFNWGAIICSNLNQAIKNHIIIDDK